MERYDGKTKKDDFIKYGLIALGIIVLFVIFHLISRGISKASHPDADLVVAVGCEFAVDFEAEAHFEQTLAACIPDLDGNGEITAAVTGLILQENESMTQAEVGLVGAQSDLDRLESFMDEGTYPMFFLQSTGRMDDPMAAYCTKTYCRALPEDLAAEGNPYAVDLLGCAIFADVGWERIPFYGCIHKDVSDEMYEQLVQVLRTLKSQ